MEVIKPPIAIVPVKPGYPFKFSSKPTKLSTIPLFPDSHLDKLCKNGRLSEAILALDSIAERGSKVKPRTYMTLLQSCIDAKSVKFGREVHARIGLVEYVDPFVETKLVSMYAKLCYLDDARRVFDEMRDRNLFTWSAMIGGFYRAKRWKEVLELFVLMMKDDGIVPNQFLLPKILEACGNSKKFEMTKVIHSMVIRCGFSGSIRVNNSIFDVYVKCGKLDLAKRISENMDKRDVVTWNAIISGLCHSGQVKEATKLLDEMREEGTEPGLLTWNILIANCSNLGKTDVAMGLMKEMESFGITPDVFTWTSMISGLAHNNRRDQALDFFREMLSAGVNPTAVTITIAASVCASLRSLNKGLEIHAFAIKMGLIDNVLVGNSLVNMYSKCGQLEAAQEVFDTIKDKNLYSWNSMIGSYCEAGYCGKACELLVKMQESDILPNVSTWNIMISVYIQNGDEDQAIDIFQRMEKDGKFKLNTATWNSLMAGYLHRRDQGRALGVFRQMQSCGVSPNLHTMLSVLHACTSILAAKKVREIHGCVLRRSLESQTPVVNSLLDTYANTGNMKYSKTVFDIMSSKDIITWNSIIAGYVLHGLSTIALYQFNQMKKSGLKPNRGTFVSVINAFSLSGLIDMGVLAFSSITEEYGIDPSLEHYSAMVDLYGRSGKIEEAMEFIEDMPVEPDFSIWEALLTASRIHRNFGISVHALNHLLELEPGNHLIQRLRAQADALVGKKSESDSKMRMLEKESSTTRNMGWSWIEVNNRVYTFVAGDQSKPHLYPWLNGIPKNVGKSGVRDGLCFEEEDKEEIGGVHSEKLAIAFALIEFPRKGQCIRIVKHLRMCEGCHETAKYISMAYRCEIYLSDSKRLHRFSKGKCSCRDYW
ncbi:pentatricopeptide repeat-containing protein At1g19720-like [Humulus lupulus]|uniref:pentatricopeptide repeat-containing protein At1g19720-like n=1 Tax=Humulus lupulus TaxID=3486 RepID=UPI002B4023AD|nr:pentatricopeptide repeat-containing protein At1g19720-like [Humulus lupulus]